MMKLKKKTEMITRFKTADKTIEINQETCQKFLSVILT